MKNSTFRGTFQQNATSDGIEMETREGFTQEIKLIKITFEKTSEIVSNTSIVVIER